MPQTIVIPKEERCVLDRTVLYSSTNIHV